MFSLLHCDDTVGGDRYGIPAKGKFDASGGALSARCRFEHPIQRDGIDHVRYDAIQIGGLDARFSCNCVDDGEAHRFPGLFVRRRWNEAALTELSNDRISTSRVRRRKAIPWPGGGP